MSRKCIFWMEKYEFKYLRLFAGSISYFLIKFVYNVNFWGIIEIEMSSALPKMILSEIIDSQLSNRKFS